MFAPPGIWQFFCFHVIKLPYLLDPVNKEDQKISERIMKYLQARPHACDTLDGISRFWIEFERVDSSVDAVKKVLDILVERGVVIKIERNSDKPVYKHAMKT